MTEQNAPAESSAAPQRMGTIVGSRLCASCGYDLTGQPVLRESHYQLLIARCPECGQAASLQEYPQLGKWANRWAMLAAGLYLMLITALLLGTATMVFGFGIGMVEMTGSELRSLVNEQVVRHELGGETGTDWQMRTNLADKYWQQTPTATLIRQAGGWGRIVRPFLTPLVMMALGTAIMGVIIAVVAANLRGWRLLMPVVFVAIVAASFGALAGYDMINASSSWSLARSTVLPVIMPMTFVILLAAMAIAMYVGRPIARWLLTILLPPRLRGAWSWLWLTDGKTPQ